MNLRRISIGLMVSRHSKSIYFLHTLMSLWSIHRYEILRSMYDTYPKVVAVNNNIGWF